METIEDAAYSDVVRLTEITSDAVALCSADGTILHINRQFLVLLAEPERERVVGADIKDLLYSDLFERSGNHELPFPLDGSSKVLMLKLADGSFIPVGARALSFEGHPLNADELPAGRVIVVLKSLEERFASDRRQRRLLSELRAANKRLSGTLSIIMSTIGSNDLPALLDTVLNNMVESLDASGATVYFAEGGGFKLRGVSQSLAESYVPDFIPYGAGIPTYVLRSSKSCRISVIPASSAAGGASGAETGIFYDIDDRHDHKLRFQDTPPFKALVAVPIFFGTQVLGVMELGWSRPCTPREYDVSVMEVICDYLSIELVGMMSSIRTARIAELERSLNRIRDILYAGEDEHSLVWGSLASEIRGTLSCHLCPVLYDRMQGRYVIDFEGGSQVALPGTIEETFFSEKAPAARMGSGAQERFAHEDKNAMDFGEFELKRARIVRVDRTSSAGRLLRRAGLPSQGVFIDLGFDVRPFADSAAREPSATSMALVTREVVQPQQMFLLLRSASQEPFDDVEFDYLTHLAHDIEVIGGGVQRHKTEQHIAQTLQAGMRNTLGAVPGITTDALYSSATSQALVGGDFYTLIRLPDDRAVMILGDASGKGIEAASMSALAKTALSAYAWEGASPAQMAAALNSMLMSFSRPETFVTAFMANIDLRAGSLTYCSAGHPPAMLLHPSAEGSEVDLVSVQSGVMGAFETMSFEDGTLGFHAGDILFMYTDGVIEARDPAGDFFGELRLREVLLHAAADGVEGICAQVLAALDAFTASVMDDDIAMVALRFDEGGA